MSHIPTGALLLMFLAWGLLMAVAIIFPEKI
jgi:hypothetical protein